MNIIKPSANAIAVTTQNTVNGSTVLYVSAATAAQVNLYSNSTTQYASFVLPAGQYIFVQKAPTDLISSNATIQVTSAAYRG
jgi:uncharacterized protein YraI